MYNTYLVTIKFAYPAWDEKDGLQYFTGARSRNEAISRIRRRAADDGHTTGRQCTFTARVVAPREFED